MLRKFSSLSLRKRAFSSVVLEAMLNSSSAERKFHASSFKSINEKLWDLQLAFKAQQKIIHLKKRLFSSSPPPEDGPGKDALEVALEVSKMFSAQKFEYALGGSLALGIWSTPRATADADINVFTNSTEENQRVINCLATHPNATFVEGHDSHDAISREEAVRLASASKEIHVIVHGVHVDVFLPKTPLESFAKLRKQTFEVNSQAVNFLDAETIVVYKLLWKRPKDLADVADLFQVYAKSGKSLDVNFISDMIALHMVSGTTDESFLVLKNFCARFLNIEVPTNWVAQQYSSGGRQVRTLCNLALSGKRAHK